MFKKTKLKNGLRIITAPMKNTKTVTVLFLVKAGSKYETKKISGLSHFLEHMFFKGTKKRPTTLDIASSLDSAGGEYNAFTGKEYAGYFAKVDYKNFDLALDVISDMLLYSKFDQNEIDKEKGVILEEMNMYYDTPMSYVGELFENLLYKDQPAGWDTLGEKDVVLNLQRKNFINYWKDHYTTKNSVICVAGNIENKKAIYKIKKYFSELKDGEGKDKKKVIEKQEKPQFKIKYKKTDQAHLCLGVRGYDIFHQDKMVLNLLSVILGGNMSSRLFISLREKEGLAYYIRTLSNVYTDSGYLMTQAGVDNKRVERAIELILSEYKKIKEKGVSEKELKKAKDYIKGKSLLSFEASDDIASFFAGQEILAEKILTLPEKFAKIDKVSVDDIKRVAKDIFIPKKLNLAMIGPFKKLPETYLENI